MPGRSARNSSRIATTVLVTLSTDLLIGVLSGIALKVLLLALNGVPLRAFFNTSVEIVYDDDEKVVLLIRHAAIFSNWLRLKKAILGVGEGKEVGSWFSPGWRITPRCRTTGSLPGRGGPMKRLRRRPPELFATG